MSTNPSSSRERQRRYAERKRLAGFIRRTLWLRKHQAKALTRLLALSADDLQQVVSIVEDSK